MAREEARRPGQEEENDEWSQSEDNGEEGIEESGKTKDLESR